jgi:hypothetical protein
MATLDIQSIAQLQQLQKQTASLLLYQSVLEHPVGRAFFSLLKTLENPSLDRLEGLKRYGRWFQLLADHEQSWQDYVLNQVLSADNPFTRKVQQVELSQLNPALITAAKHDLSILQNLYDCSGEQLSQWVQVTADLDQPLPVWTQNPQTVNAPFLSTQAWADAIAPLASYYRQHGTGIVASYRVLRWHAGQLTGVPHPDPVCLDSLVGYEWQRDALLQNTEFLLSGYPALHVLLYGSRGSGKSSLVKALLNHYGDRPLRLIEVAKSDLKDLSAIADQIRAFPQKFILFVDDLSFEDDDDAFKALKVVLEGNTTARPQNLVVYATSNRRHLIREFFDERPRPQDADEIHAWDTVQEKLSFSDRFGLTLTFEPANQSTYLAIVHRLAAQSGIALPPEVLEHRALQWATRHNGRSGRTARQLVSVLQAEQGANCLTSQ